MESPLVSVTVITYNSSATVVETLNSIYKQTYQNIELIISDDCSTDNTIELCQLWLNNYQNRFQRTELIKSSINTGTSANLNRAEDACHGEWVKGIAGDDMLKPKCIETYINYVLENPDAICCFSKPECFGASEEENNRIEQIFNIRLLSALPETQLHELLFGNNFIPAVSCFYNLKWLHSHGIRNDERIPLLEDWPKWINILRAGGHFDYLNQYLVRYRLSSGVSTQEIISKKYFHSSMLFTLYYRYPAWVNENEIEAAERLASEVSQWIPYAHEAKRLANTKTYRLGRFLLKPIKKIMQHK